MKQYLMVAVIVFACAGLCLAQEPAPAAPAAPAEQGAALAPVESTLIQEVGYDAETQVLTVKLVDNADVYEYQKVPEAVYKELMAAESKGSYFAKNIKGKYEFTKKAAKPAE